MEAIPGVLEALFRPVEILPEAGLSLERWRPSLEHWELSLDQLRFSLKLRRLFLEPWRFTLEQWRFSLVTRNLSTKTYVFL